MPIEQKDRLGRLLKIGLPAKIDWFGTSGFGWIGNRARGIVSHGRIK